MSIDAILTRQAQVISRDQALAAGLAGQVVDQHVRCRRWRPLHPRVYLVAAARSADDEVRVRAALLWAGENAVLSGLAAAWWHELIADCPPVIGVTVERGRGRRSRAGVDVRCRALAPSDRTTHRGLVVTALPLTVLDAAVQLGSAGGALLDHVLRDRLRLSDVRAAHLRNRGAPGSATAGRLLAAAAERSTAAAEATLVALLRHAGAAGWCRRFRAAGHLVPVAFPAACVAILVEGWAGPAESAASAARLAGRGWMVLRFPWHDLTGDPRRVLAEIAQAVARGMPARVGCGGDRPRRE